MNRTEIFNEINWILNSFLKYDKEHIFDSNACLLGENPLLDSLLAVKLLTWCEEFFNIKIITVDFGMDYLATIDTLVEKVYELKSRKDYNEDI